MTTATGSVAVVYVGIALVALTAAPVIDGKTALRGDDLVAPVLGITRAFEQPWLADSLTYVFAAAAVLTLIEAAASAMLGLSRLGYSLALNRQIPSGIGRLHPRFGTPYILIGAATLIAALLVLPQDVDFLVGLYAFGALHRADARPPEHRPPALPRARPAPALRDAALGAVPRREPAAARRCSGRRWRCSPS